jgi:hypothetical protein
MTNLNYWNALFQRFFTIIKTFIEILVFTSKREIVHYETDRIEGRVLLLDKLPQVHNDVIIGGK